MWCCIISWVLSCHCFHHWNRQTGDLFPQPLFNLMSLRLALSSQCMVSVLKFSASQQSLFFHFFVFPLSLIPATNLLSAAISEGRHQLLSSPSILWAPRTTVSRYTKRHDDLLQMSGVAPMAPRGLGGTGCSWITRDIQRRIGNFSSQNISPQGKGHLP